MVYFLGEQARERVEIVTASGAVIDAAIAIGNG